MKDQDQIKAIAELDGFRDFKIEVKPAITYYWAYQSGAINWEILPDYLTSRDAIVPVIEKNYPDTTARFLKIVINNQGYLITDSRLAFATPPQLCEALLRANGKWTNKKELVEA